MIKPAQLYRNELIQLYYNTFNDPKYMYYRNCWGTQELSIPDNTYDTHNFAIIENDEVIGYIKYNINYASKVVYNIAAISFKSSVCFGLDLLKVIDDIFIRYNMNKIEFTAILDNPVIQHYYKFIDRYGGREVGILKDSILLEDNKLHHSVQFELFKGRYLKNKNNSKRVDSNNNNNRNEESEEDFIRSSVIEKRVRDTINRLRYGPCIPSYKELLARQGIFIVEPEKEKSPKEIAYEEGRESAFNDFLRILDFNKTYFKDKK